MARTKQTARKGIKDCLRLLKAMAVAVAVAVVVAVVVKILHFS